MDAVKQVIAELNNGTLRVATREAVGQWTVHQWIKKAVLLSFRLKDNDVIQSGDLTFYDKVHTKFAHLSADELKATGVRVVPPAVARRGSYIAKGAILMPSYVNIGAYVGEGTMVDTWATVGSCAQIGTSVHLSAAWALAACWSPCKPTPPSLKTTASSARAPRWSKASWSKRTRCWAWACTWARAPPSSTAPTGEISYGRVPAGSVVVSGNLPKTAANGAPYSMYAAIIVKQVDAQTRSKTSINDLLRD